MNKFSDQKKASADKATDDTPNKANGGKATPAVILNTVKAEGKTDALKSKWKSKVTAAKSNWGKLSSSELLKSDGDAKILAELVYLRYSISLVDANKQVKQFLDKCHC
jgi:uncharacterized protein YjbJ (UPF0337 family)